MRQVMALLKIPKYLFKNNFMAYRLDLLNKHQTFLKVLNQ